MRPGRGKRKALCDVRIVMFLSIMLGKRERKRETEREGDRDLELL